MHSSCRAETRRQQKKKKKKKVLDALLRPDMVAVNSTKGIAVLEEMQRMASQMEESKKRSEDSRKMSGYDRIALWKSINKGAIVLSTGRSYKQGSFSGMILVDAEPGESMVGTFHDDLAKASFKPLEEGETVTLKVVNGEAVGS
jgi:hypothetical protein